MSSATATDNRVDIAGIPVSTDHFIGGERVASTERFEDISPIDERVLGEISRASAADVDRAVRAAAEAFPAWAALGPLGRHPYLHRLAGLIDANLEPLAAVECEDMAMLLRSLKARVIARGARNYRAYAELALAYEERDWRSNGTWNRVQRMPAGPAAVITPWNAPFMLSTWKTAPAIRRPVSGEPVNETRRSSGWATSAAPASSPIPWITLNTPGGSPA